MSEQLANANILIVDDTPININVLFDTLEQNNYKVLVASSGESAIDRAKFGKPDLILLDIMMPGIDGFETCVRLKKDEETKDIPVIFMTALSETVDKIKGFELGAVDYITKPFQAEEVLARVNTHLTLRRLQKELQEANEFLEERVRERTKELEEAKNRAERSDRLKSEFLAQVSHEVRTPINAILSFSSLIEVELDEEPNEEMRNILDVIEKGGRRLVRTFDLILNMSEVQSGSYDYKPVKFDLFDDIVISTASQFKAKLSGKGLSLSKMKNTEDATIYADKVMIQQVVDNIIDNAVTFTFEGSINVEVYRNEAHNVCFAVEDTGIGMSQEYLPNIYEPFSQEDQGYSRRFEGNGLGLALAKRYCDINEAKISINTEKEKGSTFTVEFTKY